MEESRAKFGKRKILHSIGVILASDGASQALRFISNLILTRLLFPEHFGAMAIVNLLRYALEMFSDVGIGAHVVQYAHGEKKDYLDTAWSVQLARSFCLWGGAILLAWPIAHFRAPVLLYLIPVCGFTSVIDALGSMSIHTANRKLYLGKLSVLTLTSQVTGIVVSIVLAKLYQSVWALAAGMLATATTKTVLSYVLLEPYRPRWNWDPKYAIELWHFGKWIFVASALTFFIGQISPIATAVILDNMSDLGRFNIYYNLTLIITQLFQMTCSRVLFPVYCSEMDSDFLRRKVTRLRTILMIPTGVMLAGLMLFGSDLVHLLYPEDYWLSGSVIPLICIGHFFSIMSMALTPIFLAAGHTRRYTLVQFVQAIAVFLPMAIVYAMKGQPWTAGLDNLTLLLIAIAVSGPFKYLTILFFIRPYRIYSIKADCVIFAWMLFLLGFFYLIHDPVMDVVNAIFDPLIRFLKEQTAVLKAAVGMATTIF